MTSSMTSKYFAGIGSRKTSETGKRFLVAHTKALIDQGFCLRSGGAVGADTACYEALSASDPAEIFVINHSDKLLGYHEIVWGDLPSHIRDQSLHIAKDIHPNWSACDLYVKRLHARNITIILGEDLDSPVDVVLCWTPNGEPVGGTRTALVLARDMNIPIINFGVMI